MKQLGFDSHQGKLWSGSISSGLVEAQQIKTHWKTSSVSPETPPVTQSPCKARICRLKTQLCITALVTHGITISYNAVPKPPTHNTPNIKKGNQHLNAYLQPMLFISSQSLLIVCNYQNEQPQLCLKEKPTFTSMIFPWIKSRVDWIQ